ncbi:hypothetical protein MLD38_003482 [Melastoma candidum]|uniref:Uncharacterized protein n=1 Tax=Melastoma candidum TaxID=119954 RepID=A0ACB9S3E4_9MYRT|nr:hypothetical protein MLD38_003482 [Melastoma candidum]
MRRPKLLLILDDAPYSTDLPSPLNRSPLLPPPPPPPRHHQQPLSVPIPNPNPPFDSSIPITLIVLLTVLFFMAFFSLYLRCFSSPSPSPSPPPSSYLHTHPSKSRPHPHLLGSLPLVIYDGTCRQSDCVVCLTEFEEGETVKVIPLCRHVFHPECVDTWLSSHVSCPVCRSTLLS